MKGDPTRRAFLTGSGAVGVATVAGCLGEATSEQGADDHDDRTDEDGEERGETYEIWALDQGTDTVYVYEPSGDGEFDAVETIDVNALEGVPEDGVVPHMIDFSSDYEYAAIACTAGARTLVFRTEDYELVGNIETGAGSHMAAFSPEDDCIHVDVIGEEKIVRVNADLEAEDFTVRDEIHLPENEVVTEAGIESAAPICHQYAQDGRSLHTLGPSYHDAGLVIVDHDEFTVDAAFSPEEVPTNCGTMPHPTEEKFYLTAGLPSNPEEDEEGVGDFFVFDTEADEVVHTADTGGVDAHGFWYTPDGEELWVLNRETNDGIVLDPETDEVIDEIEAFGPTQSDDPAESDAPDILWSSPDGEYMFATLRGPEPISGDPHAATGVTPGFSVLDVDSREIVTVVEPDPIEGYSAEEIEDEDTPTPDFHGIGVRPVGDYDTDIPTSPPF
ncbi:cell surface protein [Natrononativus amylolyticus]|uniref:cell surface protein n=1 Tax=Natrononativus amylolyticus TaxID=2963434 RepID=UPI0020CF3CF2|nr:cell surface protein [Natrononativus amylolyticus]